jgi:autophagy-related protein 9
MNWQGLLYLCVSEETCASVPLVKADYLSHASFFSAHPSFFLSLYILLFAGYLIWSVAHFFLDLRPLLEMHALFQDKLHICDTDLQAIQWDTVVQRIVDLQQTSRLCIVKDQLTAHDIANRILRKENFMVAFVNRGLLPLQPLEPLPGLRLNLLTKTLEWNLYKCILDAMFDQHFRIRQSFTQARRAP